MGRAIDMENDIHILKAEVKTLKTAFEGLASTVDSLKDTAPTKKHVDLHEKSDKRNVKAEGVKPKKKIKETELATEEA
jgi:hypothetical protein